MKASFQKVRIAKGARKGRRITVIVIVVIVIRMKKYPRIFFRVKFVAGIGFQNKLINRLC